MLVVRMEVDMSREARGALRLKTTSGSHQSILFRRKSTTASTPTNGSVLFQNVFIGTLINLIHSATITPPSLGGDTARYFSIGSSLGGGAAVGVALKLIDENLGQMCSGIVVLCPALLHPEFVPDEYKTLFKAYEENWTGSPLQDGESMMIFYGHNGGTNQRANPYAFPCIHPGIFRLPPVYQAICEADPVRDDSTVLKYQLDKFGVRNWFHTYPGMPHYFWLFPQLKSSETFHQNVVEGVKWVLSQTN
ncbi:Alpha/beta hydrolase fold-3 [Penicillium atrosanguineum]|nr:Alpha/beta hydrolase fold-3 [Penicillium atrosanguineum]